MSKRTTFCALLLVSLLAQNALAQAQPSAPNPPTPRGPGRFAPSAVRNVVFTYSAEIAPNPSGQQLEIWIPLPRDDAYQRTGDISIKSTVPYDTFEHDRFGNRVVHVFASPVPETVKIKIRFDAVRREQIADFSQAELPQPEPRDGTFAPFLRPNRLVPIDGQIAQIGATLTSRDAPPLQQARAIYDYVTSVMTYDKSGEGWGRGDALYACNVRRGNCTDFHSLFIALARARGIPARFIIGFPLGALGSGQLPGYHCWAEFYAGGVWVPVDASEASKMPFRHNYYFGRLDADRIAFTLGRDLELIPRQHGEPLNYLIFPYAEEDGAPLPQSAIRTTFEYRDLKTGDSDR